MTMLNTLLYLKGLTFTPTSRYPLLFFLRFCSTTSNSGSFPASYLTHNLGFSPESASRTSDSYRIRFQTPDKPNSVIRFFEEQGFSNAQINNLIRKAPWLLSCNPSKRVLPKFEFLLSKGVSSSEIVKLVSKYPSVLSPSLKNHIIPNYESVYRFLQSDEHTVACMVTNSFLFVVRHLARNISVMLANGVPDSNIARLLRNGSSKVVFNSTDLLEGVEKVKGLGFHPSKVAFAIALIAIKGNSQTKWKRKVDAFKKWGWSDETLLQAFKRHPHCMLTSIDKINIVMNFWVNQMGWNALDLAHGPKIFGLSMEKSTIPRALVVQYLLAKGLRKKSASLYSPFAVSEKKFLEMYVMRFKEDKYQLLKLYQEKTSVQGKKEDGAASGSYQMVNS